MTQTNGFSLSKDKIQIALLEGIHPSAVEALNAEGYTNVLTVDTSIDLSTRPEWLDSVHMLGIRSRTRLTSELLASAPRLFAVGCFSVGTDQVDLEAAAAMGIPVFNAPHSNTRSVAELVVGLAIMLLRDIFRRSTLAHEGQWMKTAKESSEARGKTLGIIGYGHIGSQVSVLAEGLGMRILYYDVATKLPMGNAESVDSLDQLLAESHVVTLHVPEAPDTRNLMSRGRLEQMRAGAYLINASRGSVVDLEALAEMLESGRLAGAAVDVYPREPKDPSETLDTPLQGLRNAILTPHIGGSTQEAQRNIGAEVARKLAYYSDRGTTHGAVNFPELNLAEHENSHRILHIHQNVPGVMRNINRVFATANVNVVGQHLQTRGELGYVVLDIEGGDSRALLAELRAIEGTLRARVLY